MRIEVLVRVRLDEGAFAKREMAYLKLQQVAPIGMFELEMRGVRWIVEVVLDIGCQ